MSTIPYHTTPYYTVPHHTKAINKYTGSWWTRGAEFLLPSNPSPASRGSFNEKCLFTLCKNCFDFCFKLRATVQLKIFQFGEMRGIFACIHFSLKSKRGTSGEAKHRWMHLSDIHIQNTKQLFWKTQSWLKLFLILPETSWLDYSWPDFGHFW